MRLETKPAHQASMKRKAETPATNGHGKKRAVSPSTTISRFGPSILSPSTRDKYKTEYASSSPYKHAVVSSLIDDTLLRTVRQEVLTNISFTPKETDIYKIHQSGDLANLDGLPAAALKKLPALRELRDALYSEEFRAWLEVVTGAGKLSGVKTDMAVNVYVPGCHLLCHDDVIGSRRVSYILYLTDPDVEWEAEWGGALRLYDTEECRDEGGRVWKVPRAEWSKVIPPRWNQLSFFAVQPGESFHDVEEVFAGKERRVRMAISGWFHIPQEGEEGYEEGAEERMAEQSSLKQLQGRAEQFDEPKVRFEERVEGIVKGSESEGEGEGLSEAELDFLLQYLTPHYLTPDTVEELSDLFAEESVLQLSDFLAPRFATRLRKWLEGDTAAQEEGFRTSRPPHKHRFRYRQPSAPVGEQSPYDALLNTLLPSLAFRKWLSLATGCTLERCKVLARRFRRGLDYQLATNYEGKKAQLEYTLCITPTVGWAAEEDEETEAKAEEDNVGGYELYMAGDEDDSEDGSEDGVKASSTSMKSHTGAGDRRPGKKSKDPAIYQAAGEDDEDGDDGVLFSNAAGWNTMSIVLRDRGTMKFVKYVSASAPGDRWDFVGEVEVVEEEDDGDG